MLYFESGENVKKILYYFLFFIISILSLFSCTNQNSTIEPINLIISVNETQKSKLEVLVDSYNELYKGEYNITFDVSSNENLKNYKLYHNDLPGDIIAFDSFNEANELGSSYLIDLTVDDSVDYFQSNIINYLKDNNERLYVFPSVGKIYSNIYNLDIMNKYNYSIPKTLEEQLIFAKRAESKLNQRMGNSLNDDYSTDLEAASENHINKTSSTIGGNDSVLFALMQIAFPEFLSSTKGTYFLREYTAKKTKMADSEYIDYFKEIFKKFRQLYYLSYYSLDDVNNDINAGIDEFLSNKTIVLQTSFDYQYTSVFDEMANCSIEPFVGKRNDQNWIASKPLFYLAVNKNINSDKYEAARAFFQYFASTEGQNLLSKTNENAKPIKNDFYISYVKDSYLNILEEYKNMQTPLENGRVFIVDTFFRVFDECVDLLIQYVKNEITIEELINTIDNRKFLDNKASLVNVEGTFDYDSDINKCETKIQNFLTDTIRKYANTPASAIDAVLIDNDAINANIYPNTILKSDLNIIFKNKNLIFKKIDISDLYTIINGYIDNKEIPFISGLRIKSENGILQIYNQTNNLLVNGTINILIDENILLKYGIPYEDINKLDIITIFSKIIDDRTTITAPSKDDRYGNINFKEKK